MPRHLAAHHCHISIYSAGGSDASDLPGLWHGICELLLDRWGAPLASLHHCEASHQRGPLWHQAPEVQCFKDKASLFLTYWCLQCFACFEDSTVAGVAFRETSSPNSEGSRCHQRLRFGPGVFRETVQAQRRPYSNPCLKTLLRAKAKRSKQPPKKTFDKYYAVGFLKACWYVKTG